MSDADFAARVTATHRAIDALLLRSGRLLERAERLRDDVRMLRLMVDVERDIMEAEG